MKHVVLAASLFGPRVAAADPAPVPDARGGVGWYGYEILVPDAIAAGGVVAGVTTRASPLWITGVVLFVAMPALIHARHGQSIAAVRSPLLRIALVIATARLALDAALAISSAGPVLDVAGAWSERPPPSAPPRVTAERAGEGLALHIATVW